MPFSGIGPCLRMDKVADLRKHAKATHPVASTCITTFCCFFLLSFWGQKRSCIFNYLFFGINDHFPTDKQ